jgi:YD repeat-containing protein
LADNQDDSQRDLFSYNTPAGSNTFLLTPTAAGYVALQPEPVRISAANGLSSFTVVDASGTIFHFADSETTFANGGIPNGFPSFQSAWHLSSISSPTSQERAVYTYTAQEVVNTSIDYVDTVVINGELDESSGNPSGVPTGLVQQTRANVGSTVAARYPTQIDFPGGRLKFVRESTSPNALLDYIDLLAYDILFNEYVPVKRFDLVYTTKYRTDGTGVPFLSEVQLKQSDGTTVLGRYTIAYNESFALPAAGSVAKDRWGYFNGQTGQSLLVPHMYQIRERATNPATTDYRFGDADRDPNEDRMKAWTISQIDYPTGGATQFDFETNRYGIANTLAGGLRIREMRNYAAAGELAQVKRYAYGAGTFRSRVDDLLYNLITLNYFQPSGTASPGSHSYKVVTFTSSPTYPLTPDEGSPVTYSTVTEYTEDGAGHTTGKSIHEFRDEAVDAVFTVGPKLFVNSRRWQRGQLSRLTHYNAANVRVAQTDYEYSLITSGGHLGTGVLVYESLRQIGQTSLIPGTNCLNQRSQFIPPFRYAYAYGLMQLSRTREEVFDIVNTGRSTVTVTETDYDVGLLLPRETRQWVEGPATANAVVGERFSYPQDFGPTIPNTADNELLGIRALQQRDIYQPIETVRFRRSSPTAAPSYKAGTLTTYKPATVNGLNTALPYQTYLIETEAGSGSWQSAAQRYVAAGGNGTTFLKDPLYGPVRLTMTAYDAVGNLTSYSIKSGATTAYTYLTTEPASGVPFSMMSSQTQDAEGYTPLTTTYESQRPLLGIEIQTDPRGLKTTYQYDGFGRLRAIKDHYGRIVKQYTYRYATEP